MIQDMTCRMMAESDIDLVVPLYIEQYNTFEDGAWTPETTYKRIHQVWSREDSLCMILEQGNEVIADRCELPEDFNIDNYAIFQGKPSRILGDGDIIDLGERMIQVLHTPGHSPGHLCFWEDENGYLFSGDLVYEGTLFANYPSTDPQSYLASLEKIAVLPTKQLFPGHHSLDIRPELIIQMRDVFRRLNEDDKLCHGSGTHDFGDWAVML